ncbi:MAG: hypothetical protein R1F52_00100 [Candidatus Nitrosoabyssus spongiisocia]|nr:MAG: hypothetical protein R1F52_00100 [Nitrosopumilaceae archaeon AB1(1)]
MKSIINHKKNALEKPILAILFIIIALGASGLAGAWFTGLVGNITTLIKADVNDISISRIDDTLYLSGVLKNIGTVTISSYNFTVYHDGTTISISQGSKVLLPGQQSGFDAAMNATQFGTSIPDIGQKVRIKINIDTLDNGNEQIERIVRVR